MALWQKRIPKQMQILIKSGKVSFTFVAKGHEETYDAFLAMNPLVLKGQRQTLAVCLLQKY
jgi:hypothetical protein